jgi:hypothetical protein
MEFKIEIPAYDPISGFQYKWEDGFEISTKIEKGEIVITANREGLISLANHLLNLAQEAVPSAYHLHLDEYNSLEEGSSPLILQKNR